MRYLLRHRDIEIGIDGDRLVDAIGTFDVVLDLHSGHLRPGLINAHDHLHRNHFPRLGRPPYPDAYAWGADIHRHDADAIARARRLPRREALLFGALKNLISGVTTVVHHDPWEAAFDESFPVRVAPVRVVHSLGIEPELAAHPRGDPGLPLCLHLAEGVTSDIAAEVMQADRLGLIDERLVAVHVVGLDTTGVEMLVEGCAAVAWCPTSNDFLFSKTAPKQLLERVDVLLGSDSLLTGSGTLLHEMHFARRAGLIDDSRLLGAVGGVAARRLGLPAPEIVPGAPADLLVLARPIWEASCEDVLVVIVAGVPQLADLCYAEIFTHLGTPLERVQVGARAKLVAAPLGAVAARVVAEWPESRRIFA